jgi:hypothetical protein
MYKRTSAAIIPSDRIMRREKREPRCIPSLFRRLRASVRRPRVDEHSSVMSMLLVFCLHREMRRLACVPTKNDNRDVERTANIREKGTTDALAGGAATSPD